MAQFTKLLPQTGKLRRALLTLEQSVAHRSRPQVRAGTPRARSMTGRTVAAITNQVASTPGQHGVPYKKGDARGKRQALVAAPTESVNESSGMPEDAPTAYQPSEKIRAYPQG